VVIPGGYQAIRRNNRRIAQRLVVDEVVDGPSSGRSAPEEQAERIRSALPAGVRASQSRMLPQARLDLIFE
jgi:hypothetical protein